MAIAEGQFSDVEITISKSIKNQETTEVTGITIHKKSSIGDGSKTVIKAKDGKLVSSEQSSILQLVLNDGYYYEDLVPNKYEDRIKMPFVKSHYKKYTLNIDLSQLNKVNVDDENIANTNTMLTINE
jgi:lipopolysaccharide export system permease protein